MSLENFDETDNSNITDGNDADESTSSGAVDNTTADTTPEDPTGAKVSADAASVAPSSFPAGKIRKVEVTFTKAIRDANHHVMPAGTAVATYGDDSTLTMDVTGGAHVPTYGITDAVINHPVIRKGGGDYKNHKGQPMPYAVFYNGGEALHVGRLDHISHGCVHVGDTMKMMKVNKDTITGTTKVSVHYGAGVLDKIWNQHM